jgi:hypothetical protein
MTIARLQKLQANVTGRGAATRYVPHPGPGRRPDGDSGRCYQLAAALATSFSIPAILAITALPET